MWRVIRHACMPLPAGLLRHSVTVGLPPLSLCHKVVPHTGLVPFALTPLLCMCALPTPSHSLTTGGRARHGLAVRAPR